MADGVHPCPQTETEQALDPELEEILRAQQSVSSMSPVAATGGNEGEWDAPLD